MRGQRTLVVALAALSLSGCGGVDRPEHVTLEPTRACLDEAGVPVEAEGLDFVASTALGGGLRAELDGNTVTVAFGESPEDAGRIEQAYQQFSGENIPLRDLLFRDRNAVLLWEEPPSDQQRTLVVGCLDG